MNLPKVSIIIVNWNGKKYLKECFDSVFSQTYSNYEVIFVDNGSTDGSAEYIEKNFPKTIIIRFDKNYGFAMPNNIGIEEAFKNPDVQYIATLNNDTKVDSHWLEEFIKVAENDDQIGMCASKTLFFYTPELIDNTGILISSDGSGINRGYKEKDSGQYDINCEVFGACAAAALYKRKMLNEIGFFDGDFFAYYEDIDLSWRARLAGWKCMYVHSAVVYHVHSATGIAHSPFKSFYLQRNRFFVIIKNLPLKMAIQAILFTPIKYLYLLNNVRLKKGHVSNYKKNNSVITMVSVVLKAWIDVTLYFPTMIGKRKNIQKMMCVSTKEIKSWFNDDEA